MPRVLSLYLPSWHVSLVRRREVAQASRLCFAASPDPPSPSPSPAATTAILLVTTTGQRQLVEHCCHVAAAAGVKPGMTLAHARALLPLDGVRIETFRPQRDAAALGKLAEWAVRFAPIVTADPPDGLLMDVSGCQRLYGGEERLAARVLAAVNRLGFPVRLAIAPTAGAAWALSHYGHEDVAIIREPEVMARLSPLPVAALRIEPQTAIALAEVGVLTIEHLLAIPRHTLPARFGPQLLKRLDQATGALPEFIEPVRPAEPLRIERTLDGPTTSLEVVQIVVRDLVEKLCELLARRESGVQRLELFLDGPEMAAPILLQVVLSRPSRSAGHLWSLLQPQVENTHLGDGIEQFSLTAARTARIRHRQDRRWAQAGDDVAEDGCPIATAFGEFLDTLVNRLGPDRVLRMEPMQSHRPERAFRALPALAPSPALSTPPTPTPSPANAPIADRPTLLFPHPEPIQAIALAPDGIPQWLRWRGVDRTIVGGVGPERIGPEWWLTTSSRFEPTRDYFKIQDTEGLWLWVFHDIVLADPDSPRRWFVHGLWA